MASVRRLAAIMFTDMVGNTAAAQSDEAGTLKLIQEQEGLVRPMIPIHRGREVKSMGDGFLVEFDSALHAVQCAIDIQQHMHDRNARPGLPPILLRIGVHLGDVEERAGDIFGDAVNIASRIRPLSPPGGVCISGPVFDQVRNKLPNQFEKLAPKALKNVRFPMDVYRVALPWEAFAPPTEAHPRARIAVLPLSNISPDPKDEYFADGLTEELINALSTLRELRVIARTSVNQYKSTSKSVAQIGTELEVGSVLEGSVRKAGNRLRITLQLIDTVTQEHIWANSYDRDLDDVFAIQSEIADRTAGALRLELLGPDRESIRKKPTVNIAAYDLYLKGIHAARQSTPAGAKKSIRFLEEAIATDPGFSLAYSYLANTYLAFAGETLAPRKTFRRVKGLVDKALELNPYSSDAHTARGNLALQSDQNWELSELEFKRAISLNPSNATAHFWYAILLKVLGRFDEAAQELQTTIELDPLWGPPRLWRTKLYEESGRFTQGIVVAEREREREPRNPAPHLLLGLLYSQAGQMGKARKEVELSVEPMSNYSRLDRATLWAALGKPEVARQLLEELAEASKTEYISPTLLAALHALLGEKEKSLEWLERDYREGNRGFWLDYQWRAFDPIRQNPRFRSLLTKLNLPPN